MSSYNNGSSSSRYRGGGGGGGSDGRSWRDGDSGASSRDWRYSDTHGRDRERDRDRDRDRDRRRYRDDDHRHDRYSSGDKRYSSSSRHYDDHEERDWKGRKRPRSRSPQPPPGAAPSNHHGADRHDDHRHHHSSSSSRHGPGRPDSPSASSVPEVDTAAAAAAAAAEAEKQRQKKERLEMWKKKREAEKAAAEEKAKAAQPQQGQVNGSATSSITSSSATQAAPQTNGTPKLTSSLPTSISTSINATALKGLTARPDFAKGKLRSTTNAMGETSDLPEKKEIKRFTLPPMDPSHKPAEEGKIGENLEAADDEDEEEEEEGKQGAQQMDVDADVKRGPEGDKMDTSEDVEIDPLDAFMVDVTKEVKQVNEEDKKRFGTSGTADSGAAKAEVLRQDDPSGTGADGGEGGEEELDGTDAELNKLNRMEDILAAAAKSVKKRGLPQADHSKIDYEPFRKAFYHPPAEIEDMTDQEADSLRMELGAISVRGKDVPKPLTKWSHCGLPASCLDVIKRLGYEKPTPIQAQAIPSIMSGRDVIGVAKTGSGKTMAFLLPMFRHINDQRPVEAMEGPIGLIMTPTRELAIQIYRESKPFLRGLGLRAACVYGGVPISEQIAEMKKTAEIVVGTPGRIIDLLTANSGRVTNLRRVTYLVLDEADRMFDMGFEPQVMNIVNNIRPDRQTVLFSATFPKQMESLARKVLKNKPLEIAVGGKSVVAPEIEQIVEVREEDTKFTRLLEILGQTYNEDADARTLIFVDRQEAADDLLRDLMRKGYPTMSIHGGKDQVDRDSTIADFKAGVVPIVTATSIAARGLDVKQLKLVINYDVPNHMEDYVHRAGRTGRAGNKGTCVTFITPHQERYARDIVAALTASEVAVPDDLKALAAHFAEKLKAGKAQAAGSGFGGKGLERLENDREQALRAQKSAFGEGEGGAAAAEDKEEKVKEGNAPGQEKAAPPKEAAAANEEFNKLNDMVIQVVKGSAPDFVRENKVQGAVSSDASLSHTERQQASMAAALEAAKASGADTTKLAQALAKIQAMHADKKVQMAKETEKQRKAKDPDATDYHAIVPINDFPQKARWRATNKETVSMLIETTGASITNKGIYYEKGKEPQSGDPPKLQLLIESNDPERIERAVREIKLILLEATQAALEAEQRGPSHGPGRYSVL